MTPTEELYLDRFEGDRAVLIHGNVEFSLPRNLLPADAAEGEHLSLELRVIGDKRSRTAGEIEKLQQSLRDKRSDGA